MRYLISNLLCVFGALPILIFFERLLSFEGSHVEAKAWLVISSLLFLFASAIAAAMLIGTLVLKSLEKRGPLRLIKHLVIGAALSTPAYFLSIHLAKGNWVKTQSWVSYFPIAFVALTFLGSLIASVVFFKIYASKFSPPFFLVGLFTSIAILFFQSKILGGAYTYVYFGIYFWAVLVLTLSFHLLKINLRQGRPLVIVLYLFLLVGSLYLVKTTNHSTRAKADDNSLIFSNLSGLLLPSHKLTFLEKVLAVQSEENDDRQDPATVGNADWNVLFVVVDTLRADVFSPWRGKEKDAINATPFLDEFMRDSITFERSYAQASGTLLSMPSTFRSLASNSALTKYSRPIGQRFSENGFRTFAIVNNFFIEPRYKRTRALIDGFEDVQVYQKRRQNDLLTMSLQSFEKYQHEKWFAWIHFYNMHHTAFDGKFLKGMPKKKAYKRAAKWLDDQMKALVEDLEKKNLLSHTIIVFTSDHGESFGENGRHGHGGAIWEEEIRVPIAIKIPGLKGRSIAGSIGNIDLLPTLMDLVRLPRDPTLAGRSLVPYLNKGKVPDKSYYLTNIPKTQVAILRGSHKLVFKAKKGIMQHFDLSEDPKEEKDIFDAQGEIESQLRRDLVFAQPNIVKKETKNSASKRFLLEKIDGLSIRNEKASLLLTKIIAQNPIEKLMTPLVRKILSKNNPYFVKHYRELCRSPFTHDIKEEMKRRIENPTTRTKALTEIVDLWCPAFELSWIKKRMKEAQPEEREFWLSLSLRYKNHQRKSLSPIFVAWLKEDIALKNRRLIYRNLAATPFLNIHSKPFLEQVRLGLTMDNFTAESAIRALGTLKDKPSLLPLTKILKETKSVRIKQSVLHALAQMGGKDALETIIQAIEKDPILTFDGAKAIFLLGDKKGLKTLDRLASEYHNDIIRSAIRKLAKKMRSKGKQKGKTKIGKRKQAKKKKDKK